MKRISSRHAPGLATLSVTPMLAWFKVAVTTGEMMMASAQVIQHRTQRMANAGIVPNARDRKEFVLMGQEKAEAFTQSAQQVGSRLLAMNLKMTALGFKQLWSTAGGVASLAMVPVSLASVTGHTELMRDSLAGSASLGSQWAHAFAQVAHHGLKPIHSRASGNVRRLLG